MPKEYNRQQLFFTPHPPKKTSPAQMIFTAHKARKAFVRYLNNLSDAAALGTVGVTRGSFLASAYRELSVALVRSQGSVYRASANMLVRASGRQVVQGAEVPYLD